MGRRQRRSRLALVGVLLGAFASALVVVEVALRLLGGPYETFGAGDELPWMRNNPNDLSKHYTVDPEFGFRPLLGAGQYNEWGTLNNPYSLEKPAGVTRLLFMGDSVTARGKTVAALAELYGLERFEYWNAGVESYSTVQEVNFYKRFNAPIAPDHVLLWFHVNDFQTTPVAFFDDDGKLVVYAPGKAMAGVSAWWFEHSYLYRLVTGLVLDEGEARQSIAAEIRASLVELRDLLAADGIDLTVVVLPLLQPLDRWTDEERGARTTALQILDEEGIRYFDLLQPLVEALAEGLDVQEAPADFWHPNLDVARRFAHSLAQHGLLPLPDDEDP